MRRELYGSRLELGILLAPIKIFFHDSLLFVTTSGPDYNLLVFKSLNDNYISLGQIIRKGIGPDEMMYVVRMDFVDNRMFWAFDPVTSTLKKFQLLISGDSIYGKAVQSVSLKMATVQAFPVSGKICATTREIIPLNRFILYNEEGHEVGYTGDYPAFDRAIPPTATVEVFNAFDGVSPSLKKFVLAYEFTDLIEIYDSEIKLLRRVQGPDIFEPVFDLKERGNALVMKRMYGKTKYAYQGVVTSIKYLYMLYANGATVNKGDSLADHFDTIVSLDWDANPVSIFKLNHRVISIAVNEEKRVIYGLNREESEVYSFQF